MGKSEKGHKHGDIIRPDKPARWIVLFQQETEPLQAFTYVDEDPAVEQYERLRDNWTEVWLCEVVKGPGPDGSYKREEPQGEQTTPEQFWNSVSWEDKLEIWEVFLDFPDEEPIVSLFAKWFGPFFKPGKTFIRGLRRTAEVWIEDRRQACKVSPIPKEFR